MKKFSDYIKESVQTILYKKNEQELTIPTKFKNRKWTTMSYGRPGKKKYEDLKKAIHDVLHTDHLSWSDIDTVTADGDTVEARYVFGKDNFGFSLKAL